MRSWKRRLARAWKRKHRSAAWDVPPSASAPLPAWPGGLLAALWGAL